MITIGAAVFLVVVVILLFYRSCGSSHSSAVGVVQALVKAGVNGDIRKMKDCYGVKGDAPGELQRELEMLTTAECASLISITNTPSLFDPYGKVFE